ncbi:hypothetical protein GCM10012275_15140 [Longimycelium tulufanense]|uniref:Nucleic acid/nucleotide deaminase of polymorphic system toxin n=1 Tax=Longimycelium tulufanense TaxID=907463 RepID=A0A8J3FT19_9PSEU|nr:DddA-like double-stranded DNA deaminase toxin [Longimycelium tulufanense]GGM45059.1 hypothetical protein GCM10012275_15140 [Longimycelium tulufanense]
MDFASSQTPQRPREQSASPLPHHDRFPDHRIGLDEARRLWDSDLPPRVTSGTGAKTHSRWITPDGATRSMVSGRDADANHAAKLLADRGMKRTPMAVDHVETKVAARMARDGIREATIVINNKTCESRGPWGYGCKDLLPLILPAGYRLTVWDYDEHGNPRRITYTGGATPP